MRKGVRAMNETEIIKNIIKTMVEETYAEHFNELRYLFRRYEEALVREKCREEAQNERERENSKDTGTGT
jgi:hypothetical protein